MERKWLVVHPRHDGIAGLYNLGVFIAESAEEAKKKAEVDWRVGLRSRLDVFEIADMNDGWVCYI